MKQSNNFLKLTKTFKISIPFSLALFLLYTLISLSRFANLPAFPSPTYVGIFIGFMLPAIGISLAIAIILSIPVFIIKKFTTKDIHYFDYFAWILLGTAFVLLFGTMQ